MQLYAGDAQGFLRDAAGNALGDKLRGSFYDYYGYQPPYSELISWQSSLGAMALQLAAANLMDTAVIVEMELPLSSSRLDVMVLAKDQSGRPSGVIVELKQWSSATESDSDETVRTFLGGSIRDVVHPSRQSLNYAEYLRDSNSAFSGPEAIKLRSCAFLHNMQIVDAKALRVPKFATLLEQSPLFVGEDFNEFSRLLRNRVGGGDGARMLDHVQSGTIKPARQLLQHTAAMIKGEDRYTLLDDQILAYQRVLREVRRAGRRPSEHSVIVIRGGPGTGKSVIAINLLGTLSKVGKSVMHATGSKSFTETLWKVLGTKSKPQFRFTHNFMAADEGLLDALIVDEAHRIRKVSTNRFTPKAQRSDRLQLEELIRAAKVSAFFVDDFQAVRPNEIGSSHYVREVAMLLGADYHEISLQSQFRCAGSQTYLDWLEQLLEIRKTGTATLPSDDPFDFQIFDNVLSLDAAISEKNATGETARLVAGFCWPWSDIDASGKLPNDVVIGEFRKPWNAKPGVSGLPSGVPAASHWAWLPEGRDQIGCIYTAQGFEFDYVGVIFGTDLVIRDGEWRANKAASFDTGLKRSSDEAFLNHVKNVYRVLLSRGLKGAYVYFVDEETRLFVKSRTVAAAV